jgi:hypothetical protein
MTKSILAAAIVAGLALASCAPSLPTGTFQSPEDAVKGLIDTTKAGNLDALVALFGPEGREIVSSSDPATASANRDIFLAAVAQRWRLEDRDDGTKELIVGNEDWPFPVPLVKNEQGWRFDTAAGKEEILARRIGRNELAVIDLCRLYVSAQRIYAQTGHDATHSGSIARPASRTGSTGPRRLDSRAARSAISSRRRRGTGTISPRVSRRSRSTATSSAS